MCQAARQDGSEKYVQDTGWVEKHTTFINAAKGKGYHTRSSTNLRKHFSLATEHSQSFAFFASGNNSMVAIMLGGKGKVRYFTTTVAWQAVRQATLSDLLVCLRVVVKNNIYNIFVKTRDNNRRCEIGEFVETLRRKLFGTYILGVLLQSNILQQAPRFCVSDISSITPPKV